MSISESSRFKVVKLPNYNSIFDKTTGFFARWGRTEADDDTLFVPEIADIEITTSCKGVGGKLCPFCYKGNTPDGKYMALETFIKVFHKLPRTITQIAFGVDAQCATNPDWYDIFRYCRHNDYNYVVPNVTVADITEDTASKLANVCGAVAVSRYADPNPCYNTVKMLTDRGLQQVNIHIMVSEETYDTVMQTLTDRLNDPRLSNLNAIVFLGLKRRGRGSSFTPLSFDKFKNIIDVAFENNISIGFDSCSQPAFIVAIKDRPDFAELEQLSEPCEASCYSVYIDVDGMYLNGTLAA